jgi:hypothetical protein
MVGSGYKAFFCFERVEGCLQVDVFLKILFGGLGGGEKSFLFCFFEGSWKHAVHPQPSKKMDIYTTPNLPNKKRVVIHPTTLQKKKKTCSHPSILQNPKKMMFSHSPVQSKNFKKKKDLYLPRTIKKKGDLYSNPLKKSKKENWGWN